ncbi:hypothetical protein A1O1_05970 [Capronia coronata CBS 617.96]|uniref:Uncharacterized protein n=1 Tax=Capronia coronata CBS 617.96 TaxID=1182541 RepID=W9YTI7_9EURO|nr:uncharacterized protein A1O1_05970 [Capronia coronata CBS 617.96]EXJ85604.1 hypothetical protein A1O1_05970 [Capronia coronata CBS 617.96]
MFSVGITVPKLLPVTGTFAPAFGAYFVLLALRVSLVRQSTHIVIGDQGSSSDKAAASDAKPPSTAGGGNNLLIAARSHANFAENVPFALLVASFVEMNGGDRRALTASLAALLFLRIAHVEFGMKAKDSLGWGRPVGSLGTLAFIGGMSSYAAWLVKSYWGL